MPSSSATSTTNYLSYLMTSYLNNLQTSQCQFKSDIYILGKCYPMEYEDASAAGLGLKRGSSSSSFSRSVGNNSKDKAADGKATKRKHPSAATTTSLKKNGKSQSYLSYMGSFFSTSSDDVTMGNSDILPSPQEEEDEKKKKKSNIQSSTSTTGASRNPKSTSHQMESSSSSLMYQHLRSDILSHFYFTYRKQISHPIGQKYHSDKGWGCLIRSGQMLFSECLVRLYLGRAWRKDFVAIGEEANIILREGFSDSPSSPQPPPPAAEKPKKKKKRRTQQLEAGSTPFEQPHALSSDSIKSTESLKQNTTQSPSTSLTKSTSSASPRPSTDSSLYLRKQITLYHQILKQFFDEPDAPYSIQNICHCAEQQYGKKVGSWFAPTTIAYVLKSLLEKNQQETQLKGIYICEESVIFLDEIEARFQRRNSNQTPRSFTEYNNDFSRRNTSSQQQAETNDLDPFLILLPAKLGLQKINPVYENAIKMALSCPFSVGIAGGRRHHSLYFIGHNSVGNSLLYFDPHATQVANRDPETYHHPFDKNSLRCIKLSNVDPCMLMGFLIRNREELEAFKKYSAKHFCGTENPIFSIVDKKPNYELREQSVSIHNGIDSDEEGSDSEWLTIM